MSCVPADVKVGDRIWTINHFTVQAVNAHTIDIIDEAGNKSKVSNSIIANEYHSTSRYTTTEKVSRTEMVNKMKHAGHGAFTVTFNKAIDNNTLADKIGAAMDSDTIGTQAKRRKFCNAENKGEERTMQARLDRDPQTRAANDDEFGRVPVFDIDNAGRRLVDTRTVTTLVSEGVMYILK